MVGVNKYRLDNKDVKAVDVLRIDNTSVMYVCMYVYMYVACMYFFILVRILIKACSCTCFNFDIYIRILYAR